MYRSFGPLRESHGPTSMEHGSPRPQCGKQNPESALSWPWCWRPNHQIQLKLTLSPNWDAETGSTEHPTLHMTAMLLGAHAEFMEFVKRLLLSTPPHCEPQCQKFEATKVRGSDPIQPFQHHFVPKNLTALKPKKVSGSDPTFRAPKNSHARGLILSEIGRSHHSSLFLTLLPHRRHFHHHQEDQRLDFPGKTPCLEISPLLNVFHPLASNLVSAPAGEGHAMPSMQFDTSHLPRPQP